MYRKLLFLLMLITILLTSGLLLRQYFVKSWTPYYQEKLHQGPRPILLEVLDLFNNNNGELKAFDLGAGVGNDTAYLLQHGWKVWANDAQKEAIEILKSRKDIQAYMHNLTVIHTSFVDIPWSNLPPFDLIYAAYSLPFAHPTEFMEIWTHIVQLLPSGGIFVGHFFGPDHGAFNWWVTRKMTLLTKEQILALFESFHIELLEEVHEKNEFGIWDHSYLVIAQKS